MGAHAVGDGLDEGRSLAGVGAGQGQPGGGEDGQDVVAVHLDAGDAVALPRWAMEACDCRRTGSEMAHWLFWQKKTTGTL